MVKRVKWGWVLLGLGLLALLTWRLVSSRVFEPALETGCIGSPTPAFASPRALPKTLRGARIMLNPGHGMTQTEAENWGFQRPQPNGTSVFVLEDDSNVRLARTFKRILEAAGAVVLSTRELEDTSFGVSGVAAWREAARHHLARVAAPEGIWNSRGYSLRSDCNLAKDIRARPLYANFAKADLMLSLHSNAGNFLARGTQVFYGTRPFLRAAKPELPAQSQCLAQALAAAIPKAVQLERPDLGWGTASLTGSDQYGENGFALMPSVILEVGFHTNAVDGKALQQESFRVAVANGVQQALVAFLEQPQC